MSDSRYNVNVDSFQGPLEKLLELVEKKKLEPTKLNLGAVTGDFLKYLDTLVNLPKPRPVNVLNAIADFLAIASKLLLIKSRELMVSDDLLEEELEDGDTLAMQLRVYKAIKPVVHIFTKRYFDRVPLGSRTYLKGMRSLEDRSVYAPPRTGLTINDLHEALLPTMQIASAHVKEVKEVEAKVISLQKAVSNMMHRIGASRDGMHFEELTRSATRGDRIVYFLAALHLARDKKVSLVQEDSFSDIVVHHGGHA